MSGAYRLPDAPVGSWIFSWCKRGGHSHVSDPAFCSSVNPICQSWGLEARGVGVLSCTLGTEYSTPKMRPCQCDVHRSNANVHVTCSSVLHKSPYVHPAPFPFIILSFIYLFYYLSSIDLSFPPGPRADEHHEWLLAQLLSEKVGRRSHDSDFGPRPEKGPGAPVAGPV